MSSGQDEHEEETAPLKVAFDTSVLVPALVAPHPYHARAVAWLPAANESSVVGSCSWHAVAETWSVLTRLPLQPPISPGMAKRSLDRLLERVEAVPLSGAIYHQALDRCSHRGFRSGVVFDALHLVCAEKRQADVLVTFNRGDFDRLTTEDSPKIVVPPDPPEVRVP